MRMKINENFTQKTSNYYVHARKLFRCRTLLRKRLFHPTIGVSCRMWSIYWSLIDWISVHYNTSSVRYSFRLILKSVNNTIWLGSTIYPFIFKCNKENQKQKLTRKRMFKRLYTRCYSEECRSVWLVKLRSELFASNPTMQEDRTQCLKPPMRGKSPTACGVEQKNKLYVDDGSI